MDRAAKAEYLREQSNVAHTAKWAEDQSKKGTKSATVLELERKAMEEEMATTAAQLTLVRRARIKELYEAEREGWEKELSAKGLALLRDD